MRRYIRSRGWLIVLLLGVAGGSVVATRTAVAAETDAELRRRAREAYEIALRHYKVGEWARAVEKFKEAYLIRPDPSFLFNLGQSYRQMGDAPSALRAYRNYLKDSPDAPNRKDVEDFIRELESAPGRPVEANPPPPPAPAPAPLAPAPSPPPSDATPDRRPPLYPTMPPPADPMGAPYPAADVRRAPSRFAFEISAGFSYRRLYETNFAGAEVGARFGSHSERAKTFFNLRLFAGSGFPGVTTVAVAPGFLGQGKVGRLYIGGGAHVSFLFLSPVVGRRLLWDQTIGGSFDLDIAVARWGTRELLVGATAAVDLLLGSLIGNNNGVPVMTTVTARVGFGL